jgi:uncharacterized membrane protein
VPRHEGAVRRQNARLVRAFARASGVLLLGLAVAGATQSAAGVSIAIIVALMSLLAAIVSPKLSEKIEAREAREAGAATAPGGAS